VDSQLKLFLTAAFAAVFDIREHCPLNAIAKRVKMWYNELKKICGGAL
jgi:hypothetical protein